MRAIILAAGMGVRLRPMTSYFPKAILNVGKETLLRRQLEALYDNRVLDIDVVVGHLSWMFEKNYPKLRYIKNVKFAETNTIYSLQLALEQDCSTTLVVNGDVYFSAEHIKKLMKAGNAALVEFKDTTEEDVKVCMGTATQKIVSIGKKNLPTKPKGEAVGIYRIESEFAEAILVKMRATSDKNLYYEDIMNRLLWCHPMRAIPVTGAVEIDTEEDLKKANRLCRG